MKHITFLTLRIEHDAPIKDLADKAAGRVYTMSGIDDVQIVSESPLVEPAEKVTYKSGNGHPDVTQQMAQAMDSTWSQLS